MMKNEATETYLEMRARYLIGIITAFFLGAVIGRNSCKKGSEEEISQLIKLNKEPTNQVNQVQELKESVGLDRFAEARKNHQPLEAREINGEIWPAYSGGGLIRVNNYDSGRFSKENCVESKYFWTVTNSPTIDLMVNIAHDKDISRILVMNAYDPIPDPNRPGYVIRKQQFTDFTGRADVKTTWNYELTKDWRTIFKDKNSSIILRGIPLTEGDNFFTVFIQDETNSWSDRPIFGVDCVPTREFGRNYFESILQERIKSSTEKGSPYSDELIADHRKDSAEILDRLFGSN